MRFLSAAGAALALITALALPAAAQTTPSLIRASVTWTDPSQHFVFLNLYDLNAFNQQVTSCPTCTSPGNLPNGKSTNPPFDLNNPSAHLPYPLQVEVGPLVSTAHYFVLLCHQAGFVPANETRPNFEFTATITVGVTTTQTSYSVTGNGDMCTSLFDYTPPANTPSPYFIQMNNSTDPAAPFTMEKKVQSGDTITANVALGTSFGLEFVKKNEQNGINTVVPVNSSYVVTQQKIAPLLETTYNVFDDSVALSLSGGAGQGTDSRFLATHLGKFAVQLLPLSESGVNPITVNVNVVRPTALGGQHNDWDDAIINAAHETGIPPQILKGQLRQESGSFDRNTFRYEPCSSDFAYMSRGAKKIADAPFKLYAMDGALNDAGLTSTVDLRNKLFILAPGTPAGRRNIQHTDLGVTARNIWEASDNWKGHGQKWSQQTCGALNTFLKKHTMAEFLDELGKFTAQTPTASSYGVMQVMYELVEPFDWSVDDPDNPGQKTKSPRFLRDTVEAMAIKHGGSITIGSEEDVQRYWDQYVPTPASYPSQEEFFDSFKEPLRKYTGGGKSQWEYGIKIIDTYEYDYLPVQPLTVFN